MNFILMIVEIIYFHSLSLSFFRGLCPFLGVRPGVSGVRPSIEASRRAGAVREQMSSSQMATALPNPLRKNSS